MEQINVSKRVTATILSMSLLTVMTGAAIAPALGIIKAHFSEATPLLVQVIVSMPALLIIVTNLFFLAISLKYFTPLFFLLGYAAYLVPSVVMIIVGSIFIGIADGVGVPYPNTIASIKGGRNSATIVIPLLFAALYLGQFLSPLIVMPLSHVLFGTDLTASYKVGVLLSLVFLVQVWNTPFPKSAASRCLGCGFPYLIWKPRSH